MKPALRTASLLFLVFLLGFLAGYGFREADPGGGRIAGGNVPAIKGLDGKRGEQGDRDLRSRRLRNRLQARSPASRPSRGLDREDDRPGERRSSAGAMQDLRDALAGGDSDGAREALRRLGDPEAGALSSEQVRELGNLLGEAPGKDFLRDLSRALVVSGGKQGLTMVMSFVNDPDLSLEARRQAIEGLSDLPGETVAEVFPVLADFLESSPPRELEHAAAHAMARMQKERGIGALLGLLEERPGIRSEALLDALGDVGKPGDTDALLGLLGKGGSQREKASVLRALSRISARAGDTGTLMDMLRETPRGASREMIARAISESSHDLGTGFLSDALKEVAGDRRSQEWIAEALARTGGREALGVLVEAADDPEGGLDHRVLARALREFDGKDAVPVMMDLFQSGRDEEILHSLARGIMRNGDAQTVDGLLKLLGEGGSTPRRRAIAEALEEGSSSSLSEDVLVSMIKGEKDVGVARALARSLRRLHPQALAERAGQLFDEATSPAERIAFADVLEREYPEAARDKIASQFRRETDERAQRELARILGRSGESGLQQIAEMMRNEQDVRRRHSLLSGLQEALRRDDAPTSDIILKLAAGDPSPSMRWEATEIMQHQQDPAVIPALEAMLGREPEPEVQERIRAAIRDLQNQKKAPPDN